jgi:hypothetical protein
MLPTKPHEKNTKRKIVLLFLRASSCGFVGKGYGINSTLPRVVN